MKKEYISPEAIVIKIQTMGMLAVSGFDEVIDSTTPIDAGNMLGHEFEFDFGDDFNVSEAFKDDFSE